MEKLVNGIQIDGVGKGRRRSEGRSKYHESGKMKKDGLLDRNMNGGSS